MQKENINKYSCNNQSTRIFEDFLNNKKNLKRRTYGSSDFFINNNRENLKIEEKFDFVLTNIKPNLKISQKNNVKPYNSTSENKNNSKNTKISFYSSDLKKISTKNPNDNQKYESAKFNNSVTIENNLNSNNIIKLPENNLNNKQSSNEIFVNEINMKGKEIFPTIRAVQKKIMNNIYSQEGKDIILKIKDYNDNLKNNNNNKIIQEKKNYENKCFQIYNYLNNMNESAISFENINNEILITPKKNKNNFSEKNEIFLNELNQKSETKTNKKPSEKDEKKRYSPIKENKYNLVYPKNLNNIKDLKKIFSPNFPVFLNHNKNQNPKNYTENNTSRLEKDINKIKAKSGKNLSYLYDYTSIIKHIKPLSNEKLGIKPNTIYGTNNILNKNLNNNNINENGKKHNFFFTNYNNSNKNLDICSWGSSTHNNFTKINNNFNNNISSTPNEQNFNIVNINKFNKKIINTNNSTTEQFTKEKNLFEPDITSNIHFCPYCSHCNNIKDDNLEKYLNIQEAKKVIKKSVDFIYENFQNKSSVFEFSLDTNEKDEENRKQNKLRKTFTNSLYKGDSKNNNLEEIKKNNVGEMENLIYTFPKQILNRPISQILMNFLDGILNDKFSLDYIIGTEYNDKFKDMFILEGWSLSEKNGNLEFDKELEYLFDNGIKEKMIKFYKSKKNLDNIVYRNI